MQRGLDLAAVRGIAAASFGVIRTVQFDNIARLVLNNIVAGNKVGISQPHFASRCQPEKFLRRLFHKIFLLDIQHLAERHLACSGGSVFRIVHRVQLVHLALGVVGNDNLQRIQYRHHARTGRVQMLTQTMFQQSIVDGAVELVDANGLTEAADRFRRETAPPHPAERGHPRVVPAADMLVLDKGQQFTLAHHRIGQVQPGKFNLLRVVNRFGPALVNRINEPVI